MALTKVTYDMLEAAPTTLDAETWYVNASTGSDSNDGKTALTAFQTIQHAIDQLPPVICNKQIIQLANGTYNINNRAPADNPRNAVVFINEKWISGRTDQTGGGADTTGYLVIKGASVAGTIIETTATLTAGVYASECNNVGFSNLTIKANHANTVSLLVSHRTGTYVQASSIVLDGNGGQADYGCYTEAGSVLEITGPSEIKGCAVGAQVLNISTLVVADTMNIDATNTVGVSCSTGEFLAANQTVIASPITIAENGFFMTRGTDATDRVTLSGAINARQGALDCTFTDITGAVDAVGTNINLNDVDWSNSIIALGGDVHVRGSSNSFISPATQNTTTSPLSVVDGGSVYVEAGSSIVGSDGKKGNVGYLAQSVTSNGTTVALYGPSYDTHFFTGSGALRTGTILPLVNSDGVAFMEGQMIQLCGNTWGVQFVDSTTAQFAGGSATIGNSAGQYFGVTMVFYDGKWRELSRSLVN